LRTLPEMARFFVVAGYVAYTHASPKILELGCGDGWLLVVLAALGFSDYTGIDISEEALRRASALQIPTARLERADMDDWETAERFDIIILNESLYYSRNPVRLLQRQVRHLKEAGVLIVSMHRNAESPAIWQAADQLFQTGDSTVVQNRGHTWEIRLLRPQSSPAGKV